MPSPDRPSASNKILFESDGSAVLSCKTVILLAVIPRELMKSTLNIEAFTGVPHTILAGSV